jgi:hypothetical protein
MGYDVSHLWLAVQLLLRRRQLPPQLRHLVRLWRDPRQLLQLLHLHLHHLHQLLRQHRRRRARLRPDTPRISLVSVDFSIK